MLRVEHLFVSPGHNFFGHPDQPAGEHPIVPADQSNAAGRGIPGATASSTTRENYKGQITFFAICGTLRDELNLPRRNPQATRRNALFAAQIPSRADQAAI